MSLETQTGGGGGGEGAPRRGRLAGNKTGRGTKTTYLEQTGGRRDRVKEW